MIGVGAAVHPHLRLVLHHADDEVGRVVDEQRLADRLLVAEEVLGDLVAEEDHAAALLLVFGSEEASARLRVVLARFAVDPVRADDAEVHRLPAV